MSQKREKAVLAGGCFWGMQDLIRKRPGVLSTRVGYTGGDVANATYRNHGTHAEAIEIVFDPEVTSYRQLLEFFFQIHDPTTLNRQGNDIGTQYRTALYPTTEAQMTAVRASLERYQAALTKAGYGLITTEVRPFTDAGPFYYAEAYHQQYLFKNPGGYCNHGFCQVAYDRQDLTRVELPSA